MINSFLSAWRTKREFRRLLVAILGIACLSTSCSAFAGTDACLSALDRELKRSMSLLKGKGAHPMYFLSFRVTEDFYASVVARNGCITSSSEPTRNRVILVDVRVGSEKLDNSHEARGFSQDGNDNLFAETLPFEDNELAIRNAVWRATDKTFKAAQKQYALVRASKDVKVAEIDQSGDFSLERARVELGESRKMEFDSSSIKERARRLSKVFNRFAFLKDASVGFYADSQTKYYLTSEGTRLRNQQTYYTVNIYGETVAEDGMVLSLSDKTVVREYSRIPSDEDLERRCLKLAGRLEQLRKAPLAEPFVGPAILRGKAAGVFFHEILGHRLEGHRLKDEDEGRTFRNKVSTRIMPEMITVVDDPSMKSFAGSDLYGYYAFDDEGVPGKRVKLVDRGVLKSFLMSRSPVKGFARSNGHGRADSYRLPVARQGNLMVLADKESQISYEALRKKLLDRVKAQGKEYGLIFDDIAGGSTLTQSSEAQMFQLYPLMVTRVYLDGRPDEIIRGVDIVGTPLASLEKILAAGDDYQVFNGSCGAESGWINVSASAPSLLVDTIEVQRTTKSDEKPPLLPDPRFDNQDRGSKRGDLSYRSSGQALSRSSNWQVMR